MRKATTILFLISISVWILYQAAYKQTNKLFGPIITQVPQKCKVVALTFDDGPTEPHTTQILDILEKKNVKATFFLIGQNVEKYQSVAKNIALHGHAIGNHTYSHPDLIWLSSSQISAELSKAEASILTATGQKPTLFRAPYGRRNPFLFPIAKRMNYQVISWSIDPMNWNETPPTLHLQGMYDQVVPGSIILLHDGSEDQPLKVFDHELIVKELPIFIDRLREMGYSFTTIPELLEKNSCR